MNKILLDTLDHRSQTFFSRGASALYSALKAVAIKEGFQGEVILPTMVCHAVLEAILAAGFTPRFADIDPLRYVVTPETIIPLINPRTQIIIVVHLFGYSAPIEEISKLAKDNKLYLIEDAVQGIGGKTERGNTIGSFGDFSFISFDKSKILTGQGGLLFHDDSNWDSLLACVTEDIPTCNLSKEEVSISNTALRDLYHGVGQSVKLGLLDTTIARKLFGLNLYRFEHLLFIKANQDPVNLAEIRNSIDTLSGRVDKRRKTSQKLFEVFSEFEIEQPTLLSGDAIWRYSICFRSMEQSIKFTELFRKKGGIVSTHYYPLHNLYPSKDKAPVAKDISSRIVNFWVDHIADDRYIQLAYDTAKFILRV